VEETKTSLKRGAVALLALLLLAPALVVAFPEDNTQWNDQLNVCVYHFRTSETTSSICYVAADWCVVSPEKPLTFQTLDQKECVTRVSIAHATVTLSILKPNRAPLFKQPA
jgi:hypothetical protein